MKGKELEKNQAMETENLVLSSVAMQDTEQGGDCLAPGGYSE